MGRQDTLLSAIEAIHAAGLDPDLWPSALRRMRDVAGCDAVSVEVFNETDRQLEFWEGVGVDRDLLSEYLELYLTAPALDSASDPLPLAPFPAQHRLDLSGRDRTPFFHPYLGATDRRRFAVGLLNGERGLQQILTLRRDAPGQTMGAGHLEVLAHLAPHVRQALEVRARLAPEADRTRPLIAVLDQLDAGIALLGRNGEVRHANAALAAMAAAGDGLALDRSGFVLTSGAARLGLASALKALRDLRGRRSLAAPRTVAADRPSGAAPYIISLRPVDLRSDHPRDAEIVAVAFVNDPDAACASPGASALAAAFGLTPAEARLAEVIAAGGSPSGYAASTGVSINTVYTHLRRIKDKTGVHRLSELVARLAGAVAAPAGA